METESDSVLFQYFYFVKERINNSANNFVGFTKNALSYSYRISLIIAVFSFEWFIIYSLLAVFFIKKGIVDFITSFIITVMVNREIYIFSKRAKERAKNEEFNDTGKLPININD